MPDSLANITPEKWETARAILCGESTDGISFRKAADAISVSVRELRGWIARSKERCVDDDPWIHQIAEDVAGRLMKQAESLEDIKWEHATLGNPIPIIKDGAVVGMCRKHDNGLALKMMAARDPKYRKDSDGVPAVGRDDLSRLFDKWESTRVLRILNPTTDIEVGDSKFIEHDAECAPAE